MNDSKNKQILSKIFEIHSYSDGFNGKMSIFRAEKFFESIDYQSLSSMTALELGAGEGDFAVHIIDKFAHPTVVEPATEFSQRIVKKFGTNPNFSLSTELIENFRTPERFDYIFLVGVLEHLEDPILALRQISEFLKPEGKIFATVPNARSLHRYPGVRMGLLENLYELGPLDKKVGHYRYYDSTLLCDHFQKAGLTVLKSEGILVKPFQNAKMEELPDDVIRGFSKMSADFPDFSAEISILARK